MSDLKKVREWLAKWPGMSLMRDLHVDYYAPEPNNSSIDPAGIQEISRTEDILGNVTVENQYNFAVLFVMEKPVEDDVTATKNAELIMSFQNWVQEQSIKKKAPTFGDDPGSESVKAQNGEIDYADKDGTGIYRVLLSINFTKKYEV